MRDWLLKSRLLISDRLLTVVVLCLVVAALGGWLTYTTHAAPGTDIEQTERTWSTEGRFDHQSTVVAATDPFTEGEQVSGQSVYFTRVMPVLEGTYSYTHTGDGELDVGIELVYTVREVGEENGVTHWQTNRTLATENATIAAGETAAVDFQVNVTEAIQQIRRIESQLGGSPGTTEVVVQATVDAAGTVQGNQIDTEEIQELGINPDTSTYSVTSEDGKQTYTSTETEMIETTYGPLRSGGSVLLFICPLLALGVLGIVHVRGTLEPDPERRQAIAQRKERTEFEDWISTGTLSGELFDRSRVDVNSLEDLVDIAIDSDRRVIQDSERSAYFVVEETVLYAYEPSTPLRIDSLQRDSLTPMNGSDTSFSTDEATESQESTQSNQRDREEPPDTED